MEMRVRACVLAIVLVVLGASSVFGQSFTVGAPAGSLYAGAANFNLAMSREGNSEIGAPVTICAGTGGNIGGAVANATFDTGDVFQVRYSFVGGAANDPILATTGALTGTNLLVFQSAGTAAQGATATATSAMFQPPSIGGAAPGPLQALVTITITAGPSANALSGINCVSLQGIRFNVAVTPVSAATAGPPVAGGVIIAAVNQITEGVTVQPAPVAIGVGLPSLAVGTIGVGSLNPGFPVVPTNAVGTVQQTLGQNAANILGANPTGYVSSPGGLTTVAVGAVAGVSVVGNNPAGASGAASTIARLTQGATVAGSPATVNGALTIQQNAITATVAGATCVPACAALAVNAPVQNGGGLFKSLVAAGPDVTTWLNAAGNTSGTTIVLTISNMPTGSSVTFPATTSSSQPGTVLNMALVGSGTVAAPGGTVTYTVTINEGNAGPLILATTLGANLDIPFTATVGSGAGTARVIISVGPAAGSSSIPTYTAVNGSSVLPSQLAVAGVIPIYNLFSVLTNQSTRTFPYATFTGGTTAGDFDTGLVLNNTGKASSVLAGTAAQVNIGQDGPFTILLISSSSTVTSIRSTSTCSGGGAFPGSAANTATKYNGLTSGSLKQGDYWVALLSQVTACAGITGAWSGQLVIVADIPNTSGFGFISQFTNATGGATMGYISQ